MFIYNLLRYKYSLFTQTHYQLNTLCKFNKLYVTPIITLSKSHVKWLLDLTIFYDYHQ